jgi:hypothetical protein
MQDSVTALELELHPVRRPEAVDLGPRLVEARGDGRFQEARRLLCLSHHTTAGFLDRRLRRRVGGDGARLQGFLDALGGIFPKGADYEHDRLDLRSELSEAEREREPLNADAHLAFIGGGFTNCTIVDARDPSPLWFVDLDGVYEDRMGRPVHRVRRATVVGYREEEVVARIPVRIPVAPGAGVVRLDDPELGLLERIATTVRSEGVESGRVRLRLDDGVADAGVTVNEFEALLMERDVPRVLADPLGFAGSARHALSGLLETVGVGSLRVPRLLRRLLAHPTPRVLRMQRDVSLGILPGRGAEGGSCGGIVLGTYQSPILVQRAGAPGGQRALVATIRRFR